VRTFVALACGAEASRTLHRWASRLERVGGASFRRTGGGGGAAPAYHLTLQFLGATRDEDVVPLCRALAEAARGSGPIAVRYPGLGAFPEPRRARVVFATVVGEPVGRLEGLAREVGRVLLPLGYPPEGRAWKPHVTLGRVHGRPSDDLVEEVLSHRAAGEETAFGETLSDLHFIVSIPQGGRYIYKDLTKLSLGPTSAGT
jgi:2'-5' RNA ligase